MQCMSSLSHACHPGQLGGCTSVPLLPAAAAAARVAAVGQRLETLVPSCAWRIVLQTRTLFL